MTRARLNARQNPCGRRSARCATEARRRNHGQQEYKNWQRQWGRSTSEVERDDDRYYFTYEDARTVNDIERDRHVALSLQGHTGIPGTPLQFVAVEDEASVNPTRLVFIDETWMKINMAPLMGPAGPRVRDHRSPDPGGERWRRTPSPRDKATAHLKTRQLRTYSLRWDTTALPTPSLTNDLI